MKKSLPFHSPVLANAVKQSSITYSSLRTQWSNPKNKRIGLQVDRHGFASRWQLLFNHLWRLFHSWEFAQTICEHHFTVGNLLKLSAEIVSQLGIYSNRLRTPFHSGEFAQTVWGDYFKVGNSAKIRYFHPKIIFYSLIKTENEKHNKN